MCTTVILTFFSCLIDFLHVQNNVGINNESCIFLENEKNGHFYAYRPTHFYSQIQPYSKISTNSRTAIMNLVFILKLLFNIDQFGCFD